MYSNKRCPYCQRAIALLNEKNVKFDIIETSDNPEAFEEIKAKTGWKTVPQIFINGEFVGGFDDINALDKDGKLDIKLGIK